MDLKDKYALLELIPGNGASSYRGRQLTSGRDVTVHLFRGALPENESFLSRIRTLPPEALRQVVEVGEEDGTVFLVTAAPPHRHLSEWLPAEEQLSATVPGRAEPGEFTRFFQPNSIQPGLHPEPVTPVGDTPGPGEFTRIFGPLPSPAQSIEAPQLKPPKPEQGQGEYTRIIAQSLAPAAPPPEQIPVAQHPAAVHSAAAASEQGPHRMLSRRVTLILYLLAFVAGGALVFLILRH